MKKEDKDACQSAYAKYMKEWKMSEDEAPDYLVWQDSWNAALKYAADKE